MAGSNDICMVPSEGGAEMLEFNGAEVHAMAGTGFDPDSPQHRRASDAPRYAIAIQQTRDAGDYAAADAMCEFAARFYRVIKTKTSTGMALKKGVYENTQHLTEHDGLVYDR